MDVTTSILASVARPGCGVIHYERLKTPEQPLELYDFEACPFCRMAREAISALSLDPVVYPCPKEGQRFRPQVEAKGGKLMFPYLVDPNTGVCMYESDDIVQYLFTEYGNGQVPWFLKHPGLALSTSSLASSCRPSRGRHLVAARLPEQQLELYSYEGSPFCRIVREALTEFEIPYQLHNVPRRSPDRTEFIKRSGKMQVPYLVDPNTGVQMFESNDIVTYLYDQYVV